MNNIENIYNKAMDMLHSGHSKEEVLFVFPDYEKELSPLLDISLTLSTLPKNIVPEPAMQRKYILAPTKSFWLAWLHISKFAGVSMSIMLLVSMFLFTSLISLRSAPGQVLFSVKKTTEQLQVILAYNQDKKADLQIKITQKRLNEAREIFNNPNSDTKDEQAALKELTNQTNNAIEVVSSVTKNNPQSDKNHPLLITLETLTKDQQNLLTEIKSSNEVRLEANTAQLALNESSAKITEIKNLVAIASNDQALTKLNSDLNSVIVLGYITKITKDEITVEKTNFIINTQTIILDESGKNISAIDLKLNTKVNVSGTKNINHIIATKIILTNPEASEAIVKGTSTGTITTIITKTATATNSSVTISTEEVLDPNQAIGSFILEDPAPQFIGN